MEPDFGSRKENFLTDMPGSNWSMQASRYFGLLFPGMY